MPAELIPITNIVIDRELQPRISEMRKVILDYARALDDGAQFPPITVFRVEGKLLLADGFHRLEAHKYAKRSEILTDIREGTRLDAFRFAREHNMKHGYRLNRQEVQRAIRDYVEHEFLSLKSDREIGRLLMVDNKTVNVQRRAIDVGEDVRKAPAPAPSPLPVERQEQTRASVAIAAYRQALDALTVAEGIERVQTEIGQWYSKVSAGGIVKWERPRTRK